MVVFKLSVCSINTLSFYSPGAGVLRPPPPLTLRLWILDVLGQNDQNPWCSCPSQDTAKLNGQDLSDSTCTSQTCGTSGMKPFRFAQFISWGRQRDPALSNCSDSDGVVERSTASSTHSGIVDMWYSTTSPGIPLREQRNPGSEPSATSQSRTSTGGRDGCLGAYLVFFSSILMLMFLIAIILSLVRGVKKT